MKLKQVSARSLLGCPAWPHSPSGLFAYPPLFEKHHYVKIHMQVKIFEIRNAAGEKKKQEQYFVLLLHKTQRVLVFQGWLLMPGPLPRSLPRSRGWHHAQHPHQISTLGLLQLELYGSCL